LSPPVKGGDRSRGRRDKKSQKILSKKGLLNAPEGREKHYLYTKKNVQRRNFLGRGNTAARSGSIKRRSRNPKKLKQSLPRFEQSREKKRSKRERGERPSWKGPTGSTVRVGKRLGQGDDQGERKKEGVGEVPTFLV